MRRVLLLGGDTDHNLGDTAIVSALASAMASRTDSLEISLVGNDATRRVLPPVVRHMIRRGPSGLPALAAAASRSDAVIVAGGGLFQDDDSRVKMPYWAARLALIAACNRKVFGHSIGAGPLTHTESRWSAAVACGRMRSITVRDQFALRSLAPCTAKTIEVVPDSAFMLKPHSNEHAKQWLREVGVPMDRPVIGVALRRWFHKRGGLVPHRIRCALRFDQSHGRAELSLMLARIAESLTEFSRRHDASILMLPTYNVAHEADDAVCGELARSMKNVRVFRAIVSDPSLYKAITGQLELMVSARMHPMILAAGMGTPVVGLAYNGKFEGFFSELGLEPKVTWLESLLDDLGKPRLDALLESALLDRSMIGERAQSAAARCDAAISELMQRIFQC